MIKEEKMEQRMIGQQIMAVRIIQHSYDRLLRGGVSLLHMEDLADWLGTSYKEASELKYWTERLDAFNMAAGGAEEYAGKKSSDEYAFWLWVFKNSVKEYMVLVVRGKQVSYGWINETNMVELTNCGIKVQAERLEDSSLKKGLDFFQKYYIQLIADANKRYAWVVVREMLRATDEYIRDLKSYRKKKRKLYAGVRSY